MDKADHEKTPRWGSSKTSEVHRDTQSKFIKQVKSGHRSAMAMDIFDVRAKFGNKFDGAILQMMAWAKCMRYI